MRRASARWLIIGACVVGAALLFGRTRGGAGEVRVPTDAHEVLARVASATASARELKALEAASRERPDDVARACAACRKAIELARREADPRYWGRAQVALQHFWDLPRPPDEVRLLRATIRQARHEFQLAREDLELLSDPRAFLALADVERVTGRYEEARRACEAIAGRVEPLLSTVCLAQLDSLTGKAKAAAEAVELAGARDLQGPLAGWALKVLADLYQRAGDDAAAERALRTALARDPDDREALAALADLLIELGRGGEVDALLSSRFSDDDALLRLAIAERLKLGRAGPYALMQRWRYQAAEERADAVQLRERARFWLEVEGDPQKALQLAERAWAARRESADAKVLLSAALAAGTPQAARACADFVLHSGAEEPRLVQLARQVGR